MKMRKVLSLVLTLAMMGSLAACGSDSASEDAPDVIKIGIVNPTTGALAGFGEGTPWTENLIVDYVNNELGGLSFDAYGEDVKIPIEIIVYDSESDTTVAAEMAQKLIEEDDVDIIIARHTPDTVGPVSAVAERYGVPCVSIESPVDAWEADGPYEWVYHSFWTIDTIYEQYQTMWDLAGYPAGSGATIGLIFANDSDGTSWHNVFAERIVEDGYNLIDPGQYPAGTTDYSDVIAQFVAEGVEIVAGTNTTPDFASFWLQASQLGFDPDFVTMGKAYLLASDAEAVGADLMDGNCAEVWWSPVHPYVSDLTGMDASTLTEMYYEESGREITQPMGYKYTSMELCVLALQNAVSLEPEDIRDGLAAVDAETLVGPISFNEDNYAETPLAAGQWQLQDDGTLELVIFDNTLYPEVPTTGTLEVD